jgi:uncharacterized protein (TIGR04255 family)
MIPVTYTRDPIVEAIAEVGFVTNGPWSQASSAELIGAFRAEYPGPPGSRPQLARSSHAPPAVRIATILPSADAKAFVGIGEGGLTVHVLTPYPGWVRFRPRIASAIETLLRVARPSGIFRVGIRYIDQIDVPYAADEGINDYLPCLPSRPESMPARLDGFQVVTQATELAENFTAIMRVASAPGLTPDGRLQVFYDLDLQRPFEPSLPAAVDLVLQNLDFLHARQRQIFEDSISDKTRSLFA